MKTITGDHIDLSSHYYVLVKRKWLIAGISILMCLLTMVYTLVKPKQYQANVLLQIHPNARSSLGSMSNSDQQALSEEPISVHIALIRSKFILEPVIRALNLDIELTPYSSGFFSKKNSNPSAFHIDQFTVPWKYLNKKLYLYIDKSNHYQLYTAKHELLLNGNSNEQIKTPEGFLIKINEIQAPPHSQFTIIKLPEWEVMNKIRSRLQIIDLAGASDTSLNTPDILQLSLKGTNAEKVMQLINQIALTAQVKDRERKALEATKKLEFLYHQLPIVRNSLTTAETNLNQYRFASGNLDPKLQTHYLFTHLSDIDKQLEMTRVEKIDLSQKLTAAHPDLIALNKTDKELQKQRAEILAQIKTLTKTDQIAINLVREVDVNKNLYMQLLKRIHAQQVVTAGIISDIGILSLATFPESSGGPGFIMLSLAGLIVGLILSSLGVLVGQMFIRPKLNCIDFLDEKSHHVKSTITV